MNPIMMVAMAITKVRKFIALISKLMMAILFNAQCAILNGCIEMNEKQLVLIRVLMDRMNDIIDNQLNDPFYAPPTWTYENIWHSLNTIICLDEDEVHQERRDISISDVEQGSSKKD